MKKTRHAIIRVQQRGFRTNQIELIIEYGTEVDKPGRVKELRLLTKDITRAKNEAYEQYKRTIQDLDKCKNKGVLIDPETGVIITVYPIS